MNPTEQAHWDIERHLERCELYILGEYDHVRARAHLLKALSILESEHKKLHHELKKPQR